MSDSSASRKRSAKAEPSVLGSLPATRPARIGRRTAAPAGGAEPHPAAKPKARAGAAPGKPRAAAAPRKPPRAAAPRKPVAPPPEPPRRGGPPSGHELVATVVQAVGEIAQIGVTLGGQAVRRAARRLPLP